MEERLVEYVSGPQNAAVTLNAQLTERATQQLQTYAAGVRDNTRLRMPISSLMRRMLASLQSRHAMALSLCVAVHNQALSSALLSGAAELSGSNGVNLTYSDPDRDPGVDPGVALMPFDPSPGPDLRPQLPCRWGWMQRSSSSL